MTKKMKREFKDIEKSLKVCQEARKVFGRSSLLPLEIHYTQKRVDIANKIGRKPK